MNRKIIFIAIALMALPSIALAVDPYYINAIGKNISIGNTNEIFVDNTNIRIGIGMATPGARLDVAGSVLLSAAGSAIQFNSGGPTIDLGAANNLRFNTSGVERIRIDNNGNVGIGTTSPTSKLHVSGNINISNVNPILFLTTTGVPSSSAAVAFFNGSAYATGIGWSESWNRLFIDDGGKGTYFIGNVGIGTTSPVSALDVRDNITLSSISDHQINFNSTGARHIKDAPSVSQFIYQMGTFAPIFRADGGYFFQNSAGSSTWMHIGTSGNVGIGTTAPTAKLEINGTNIANNLSLNVNNTLYVNASSSTVGIGITNPTYKFQVAGAIGLNDGTDRGTVTYSSTGFSRFIVKGQSSYALSLGANGVSDQVVLDTSGNLGIGTTTPGEKLTTNGTILIDFSDSNNATQPDALIVRHVGRAANVSYGASLLFSAYNNNSIVRNLSKISAFFTNASNASENSALAFYTLNSGGSLGERMRIDPYGNVGIGTVAPTQLLHLNSSGNALQMFQTTAGAGRNWLIGTDANLKFRIYDDTAGVERVTIDTSGNVGIGITTPTGLLHLNSTSALGVIRVENTTGGSLFHINGSNGYVGIGLTNASQRLEIAGNVTAVAYFHSSDERLKQNVNTLNGLDIVERLRGVSFEWKDGGQSVGLVAQEVEKVLPEVVVTNPYTGMKSVNYGALVGPLVESVKELDRRNAELESRLASIEAKLATIE